MKVHEKKTIELSAKEICHAIDFYLDQKGYKSGDIVIEHKDGETTAKCYYETIEDDTTDQPEPEPKQVTWDDFLSFLESEGVLENYDKNMTHKKKEIRSYEHEMWLESSFVWRISPEGGDFWNEIYTKWLDHLKTLTND